MSFISRNLKRILGLGWLFALLVPVAGVAAPPGVSQQDEPLVLRFGVYTSDKAITMVRKFRPLLGSVEARMSELSGKAVRIKLVVARDYESGIDDLVKGKVDFSRLGPASYITAKRQNPDISVLALESKHGEKSFNGVIAVRGESGIESIEDLKGTRFAFGNKLSTIGRYLSQQYLVEHGLRAQDFQEYAYLGRHDKVGAAVASGRYDAGALKESTFKKQVKKGLDLRALATFPNVTKPWVASAGLDGDLRDALKQALLSVHQLETYKGDRFLEGSDQDFARIRNSIEQNEEFFKAGSE